MVVVLSLYVLGLFLTYAAKANLKQLHPDAQELNNGKSLVWLGAEECFVYYSYYSIQQTDQCVLCYIYQWVEKH